MSRIGLITPLRDDIGFLVAKEYVASQAQDANPGVLVLSQFAGAAQELKSALIGRTLRHKGDRRLRDRPRLHHAA